MSRGLTGLGLVGWVVWCFGTICQLWWGDAYESGPRTTTLGMLLPLTALPMLHSLASDQRTLRPHAVVDRVTVVAFRLGAALLTVFAVIVTIGGLLWSTMPPNWDYWLALVSITTIFPYALLLEACARVIRSGSEPTWLRTALRTAWLGWLVCPVWILVSVEVRGFSSLLALTPALLFGVLAMRLPWRQWFGTLRHTFERRSASP